ncbi:hypothetical protein NUW58_g1769 [Xylaria curta]|uniref:Uncharacterized protein n=1 Tax=Xylaria curta TaxID=42375 RepID=A0ACC1PKC1_9PEZI|nr:hypothetical protein NUW58_g1769 [Xylaria curta]
MFKWYQNAAICYAYLDDATGNDEGSDVPTHAAGFRNSRWFTRGWTLQELLAPPVVVFYSSNWTSIGSRHELAEIIAETTQINIQLFKFGNLNTDKPMSFNDFSIAQRMSWVSQRQTTRIEDQAYCLLGLFGVNMPLTYGEGEQAFVRLQQEIMKESDDQTLFAWGSSYIGPPSDSHTDTNGGILASSPRHFAGLGHIVRSRTDKRYGPYTPTNKGLQISLPLLTTQMAHSILILPKSLANGNVPSLTLTESSHGTIAVLNCQPSDDDQLRIGLHVTMDEEPGHFFRVKEHNGIAFISLRDVRRKATQTDMLIQIRNTTARTLVTPISQANRRVLIRPFTMLASEFELSRKKSKEAWHSEPTGALSSVILDFSSPMPTQELCALEFKNPEGHGFILAIQKRVVLGELNGLECLILENTELPKDEVGARALRAQVKDAVFRSHRPSTNQNSSRGPLKIVAKVTEARRASIINLEARKATSSILGSKDLHGHRSTPLTVQENIVFSLTPSAEN